MISENKGETELCFSDTDLSQWIQEENNEIK